MVQVPEGALSSHHVQNNLRFYHRSEKPWVLVKFIRAEEKEAAMAPVGDKQGAAWSLLGREVSGSPDLPDRPWQASAGGHGKAFGQLQRPWSSSPSPAPQRGMRGTETAPRPGFVSPSPDCCDAELGEQWEREEREESENQGPAMVVLGDGQVGRINMRLWECRESGPEDRATLGLLVTYIYIYIFYDYIDIKTNTIQVRLIIMIFISSF